MAYRKSLFTYTVKIETQTMGTTSTVYFGAGPADGQPYDWDKSSTNVTIPSAGSAFDLSSGTAIVDDHMDSIDYHSGFAVTQNCRIIAISWSLWHDSVVATCTGLKIAAITFGYGVGSAEGDDAVWDCRAVADTSTVNTMSDDGQVHSGAIHFNSSNGDIAAGEMMAVVLQPQGGGAGICYGTITALLETR